MLMFMNCDVKFAVAEIVCSSKQSNVDRQLVSSAWILSAANLHCLARDVGLNTGRNIFPYNFRE